MMYVQTRIGHKWTYPWNRNRLTDTENRPRSPMGKAVGAVSREREINRWLLYAKYKQQSHDVQLRELHSMHNGKEYEKEYTYNIYITGSLYFIPETQHCKSTILQF